MPGLGVAANLFLIQIALVASPLGAQGMIALRTSSGVKSTVSERVANGTPRTQTALVPDDERNQSLAEESDRGRTESATIRLRPRRRSQNETAQAKTSRNTPIFDSFFFVYWSVIAAVCALVILTAKYIESSKKPDEDAMAPTMATLAQPHGVASPFTVGSDSVKLSETIWALNLVAAVGQARFVNGWRMPVTLVMVISAAVGCLQMLILYILVHDLDPNVDPVTEGRWTVNCMKWCMAIVISMTVVNDLEECRAIVVALFKVDLTDAGISPVMIATVAIWQYTISVYVVCAGVQVILSFGRAPEIIYSSLAVTFLHNIDNLAMSFLQTVLNLEVDFRIHFNTSRQKPFPRGFVWAVIFFCLFPMMLGMFLMGRAFYTNIMPMARLQAKMREWEGH